MTEEQVVHEETIYEGRVVNLYVETIDLGGQMFEREIIRHSGAVAMVPIDEQGQVYLVEQYRSGARKRLLELPAGGLEPGEEREVCARRELQEEIGQYPETITELGSFYVAASYTTEYITIYLAEGLRPSVREGDIDEEITVRSMPFDEALQLALTNQIADSKTLIGLVWAARHLGRLGQS
ncbi:MAG: NUDIX hydrolase [Anaerolineae bacterium]|nr:NUDIX hydrolase [Anaerolineae bacterium]